MMPIDAPAEPTKAEQKVRARQHAKTVRKERKGERRNRGAAEAPRRGAAKGNKSGVKKPGPKKR